MSELAGKHAAELEEQHAWYVSQMAAFEKDREREARREQEAEKRAAQGIVSSDKLPDAADQARVNARLGNDPGAASDLVATREEQVQAVEASQPNEMRNQQQNQQRFRARSASLLTHNSEERANAAKVTAKEQQAAAKEQRDVARDLAGVPKDAAAGWGALMKSLDSW